MNARTVAKPSDRKRVTILMRFLGGVLPVLLLVPSVCGGAEPKNGVYDLSLAELANVRISSSAALTDVEPKRAPAQVTTISRNDIRRCGARDVIELLDIFVPGFQVNRHYWRGRIAGTRGIDSPVKYILLVNGQKMNDNWFNGVLAETYLPMLGDIESVEYVNGPGSALYGAGAIGGVISIKTRSPESLIPSGKQGGGEARLSQGFINRWSWFEGQYAQKVGENATVSVYYGVEKFLGLRGQDTDFHYTGDTNGDKPFKGVPLGERMPPELMKTPYEDPLRHKLAITLDAGAFKSWFRYTKAGIEIEPDQGSNYDQYTWHNEWVQEMSDDLHLKWEANYQQGFTTERKVSLAATQAGSDFATLSARTYQFSPRVTLSKDFDANNHFAVGGEAVWEWFRPVEYARKSIQPSADFDNFSQALFAEYQGMVFDQLTYFLGARLDHDRYTETGVSPRVGLVWTPTAQDTIKVLYNRSFRDIQAQPMTLTPLKQYIAEDGRPQDEHIDDYELLYSRELDSHWSLNLGGYWNKSDFIGTIKATPSTSVYGIVGVAHNYGASASVEYKDKDWRVGLSHNYDTVKDFTVTKGGSTSIYTIQKGADLEYWNWSPHSSKLYSLYSITEAVSVDANVQVRWFYNGLREAYDSKSQSFRTQVDDDIDGNFGPSISVNAGATWGFRERHLLRFDAYNLAALVDRDLNRVRSYVSSDYLTMPVSFALTYSYTF